MRALVLDPEQRTANVLTVPKPTPAGTEVLVKVEYVALNPVDSLYVAQPLANSKRILGSDFAGHIVDFGTSIPDTCKLSIGDRVAGFVQGASSVNERPGAFAEYVVSPWDLLWKVPDEMKLEEAATVSLCALTAAQALFQRTGLTSPFENAIAATRLNDQDTAPQNFFVYGASTSVGLYAAQLVQRVKEATGMKISLIGAASKKHWDTLKSSPCHYDHLVDYRDEDWVDQVKQVIGGTGLRYAYDCISEGDTVAKISGIMQDDGKLMVVRSVQGGAWSVSGEMKVEPSYGAVWEGLGEAVQYKGMDLPASPDARAFAATFYRWLSSSKPLKPNKVRMMPGGLDRIDVDGFQLLGTGTMGDRVKRSEEWMKPVSAEKLVYRIS
jgi:NADPH:quinone reductase-like Zn-dependent oxidoreductase